MPAGYPFLVPPPPDDDPRLTIDAFLRRGGSVCVPALRAALAGEIRYEVLPDNGPLQGPVYLALREFLKANRLPPESAERRTACILIDPTPDPTSEDQRKRALIIQEEIHVAIARLNSWIPSDWWHRKDVRRQLAAREFPGIRGGECLDRDVIRFAMGPRYPRNHRRFAPEHLIVPITTGQDAGRVREHAIDDVAQTYLNIQDRSGEMLNAMAYYEDVDPA